MNEQEIISRANELFEGNRCRLHDLECAGAGDVRETLRRDLGHRQHLDESACSHHEEIRVPGNIRVGHQRHESRNYNKSNADWERTDLARIAVTRKKPVGWRHVSATPGWPL